MAVSILACSISEKSAIESLMANREQALENKDIDLYMSCISKNYKDNSDTSKTLKLKTEQLFSTYQKIDFSFSNRSIYIKNDSAKLVESYVMSVVSSTGTDYISGQERFTLIKEKNDWKILKGL